MTCLAVEIKKPTNRTNKLSVLLSASQNESIFNLLGVNCQSLATAVVQVFLTEAPLHTQWYKHCCGVACFVKDYNAFSYFIRVYSIDENMLIWQQELYNQFQYHISLERFHTFEADNSMAGLNFADSREAQIFQESIYGKLQEKYKRRQIRKQQLEGHDKSLPLQNGKINNFQIMNDSYNKKKKEKNHRFTKEDISWPTNFKHIQHLGFDKDQGFIEHFDDAPPGYPIDDLQAFFHIVGVNKNHLKHKEIREYIYNFIEECGGVEVMKEEVRQQGVCKLPPLPTRPPPLSTRVAPNIPSGRPLAPPPPPVSELVIPPTAVSNVLPPPPPPLPINGFNNSLNVVKEAVKTNDKLIIDNSRSALLQDIRRQPQLKPVEQKQTSKTDTRNELLDQIRQGVELKTITKEPKSSTEKYVGGMAGALARALAERSKFIHSSDNSCDSSENEEEEDNEWED